MRIAFALCAIVAVTSAIQVEGSSKTAPVVAPVAPKKTKTEEPPRQSQRLDAMQNLILTGKVPADAVAIEDRRDMVMSLKNPDGVQG